LVEDAGTEPSPRTPPPLEKRLVAEIDGSTIPAGTYQGVAAGPELADGRRTIVLVSDNNLSTEPTQVIALAVEVEPA
jgi:hypothetical protein